MLKSKTNDRTIKLIFDSPYLILWSKKEHFICLEPCWGMDDNELSGGKISEKEGIQVLKSGQKYIAHIQMQYD